LIFSDFLQLSKSQPTKKSNFFRRFINFDDADPAPLWADSERSPWRVEVSAAFHLQPE
jgi:hypothetical protein